MTREQKKQQRRRNRLMALCWVIVAAWVLYLCITNCNAAYDGETLKTHMSAVGAFAVGGAVMRLVCWLDRAKR